MRSLRPALATALFTVACTGEIEPDVLDGTLRDADVPVDATDSTVPADGGAEETPSVARRWDEALLRAIRRDLPRPPVHARNLYTLSAAMYDAWCVYDPGCDGVFVTEKQTVADPVAARREAISYAAYRVLVHRFQSASGAATTLPELDAEMAALGYDVTVTSTSGAEPAVLGNRVASTILTTMLTDGSREPENYDDPSYVPVNVPLIVKLPGTTLAFPDRWQPLSLDYMVSQNGIPIPASVQTFVGSRWNDVTPFALRRTGTDVYVDPGPPPTMGTAELARQVAEVLTLSSLLDANDATVLDYSPSVRGNNPLGANTGTGHAVNPVTGLPYEPNPIRRSDYLRAIAEFWADGPTSETPPGHWNVVANSVADHPAFIPRFGGGAVVSRLEFDVKMYLALNGAMHDAAIAAWGVKRKYDSVRPISLVRYMGGKGQSSDPLSASYDPEGLPLIPGVIEVITAQSSAPGERHEALAAYVGEIAVYAWPGQPANPATEVSGVRWLRAVEWTTYQRKTFVTPPFAGYISGHSTYSRAAAEVLAAVTGSPFFPGGLFIYEVRANSFVHERGPEVPFQFEWATYFDASDESGRSRLAGSIHIEADDFAGRRTGQIVGLAAYTQAQRYALGTVRP